MRYIEFIFGRLVKAFLRFLNRIIRPLLGMIIFTLLAVLEMSDWIVLMSRIGNISAEAATYGVTTSQAIMHLIILIAFAIGIILSSLTTVLGFIQSSHWVKRISQLTGILFIAYGGFQAYSKFFMLTKGDNSILLIGSVYILIGIAIINIGKKLVYKPTPPIQSAINHNHVKA